jgi:hypothetical protein
MNASKYTFNGSAIVNRASGEEIPGDEPVFIFRARDVHAVYALKAYAAQCGETSHALAVADRIADFERFAAQHPDRMKTPDTASLVGAACESVAFRYRREQVAKQMASFYALTAPEQSPPAAPTWGEPVAWIVYWGLSKLNANSVHLEKATAEKVASEIESYTEVHPLYAAPGATPPSAAQAEGASYHAWCGSADDEATLRLAASVMQDVLTDIEGWEDRALSEAVADSRTAILAIADSIALTAAPEKLEERS